MTDLSPMTHEMSTGALKQPGDVSGGPKLPITNCHTHIFIGESVPPWIAKTIAPWPLYKLFTIPLILRICKFYYLDRKFSPYGWRFKPWYKRAATLFNRWRIWIKRNLLASAIAFCIDLFIVYHALVFLLIRLLGFEVVTVGYTISYMDGYSLWGARPFFFDLPGYFSWALVAFTLFFISAGRKLLIIVFKKAWGFLSMLPDRTTIALIGRYVNIGRFAYYKNQQRIFARLKGQYPEGTRFVILPMDMAYMQAGKVSEAGDFDTQMSQLAVLKKSRPSIIFPFVAIDPRRIREKGKQFFDWSGTASNGIILKDCFIKTYIEEKGFSGFKIYPALGYYPFDKELLPLWKYAADNGIPIMTHCIRGTIYYRGKKHPEWDRHEIFKESYVKGTYRDLELPEPDNNDYSVNFTHPLNYLCLLEERLLRRLVGKYGKEYKDLFGYNGPDEPLSTDLSKLKLCFGHYGGDDEWAKHFEKDRDDRTNQLQRYPDHGLTFLRAGKLDGSWGVLENAWKHLDWYALISSLMLQYEHVYADISYIVHNEKIISLLKSSLKNPGLRTKILFGTDFYVVRNHKSDREMLADLQGVLSEDEFDQIARINPDIFLK